MIAMAYFFIFLLQFGFFSLDVTILKFLYVYPLCFVSSLDVWSLRKCSVLFCFAIFFNFDGDSHDSLDSSNMGPSRKVGEWSHDKGN